MNFNKIKKFEDRYIEAINNAINEVKVKFQSEFQQLIQENIKEDIYICSAMGITIFCKFNESGDKDFSNKTTKIVENLQWGMGEKFSFNLDLPYKMTSNKILTKEVEEFISELYEKEGGHYKAIKNGFISPHLAHIRYFLGWELNDKIIKK